MLPDSVRLRAHNSAVECHLHTVEVVGSNPAVPTNFINLRTQNRKTSVRTSYAHHRAFHPTSESSALAVMPRVRASLTMLSKLMFRSPRSIPPTYVQCSSAVLLIGFGL